MKIKTSDKSAPWPLLIVIAVAILTTAALVYVYLDAGRASSEPESDINYQAPTDDQVKAGEQTTEQKPDDNPSSDPESESTANPSQPGASNPQRGSIHLTVSSQNGTTYTIRTLIQDVTSGGNCELTLKRGNTVVYSAKAETQMVASNSTCRGFDIDTVALGAGQYTATVTYTHSSGSTSVSEDITIK